MLGATVVCFYFYCLNAFLLILGFSILREINMKFLSLKLIQCLHFIKEFASRRNTQNPMSNVDFYASYAEEPSQEHPTHGHVEYFIFRKGNDVSVSFTIKKSK